MIKFEISDFFEIFANNETRNNLLCAIKKIFVKNFKNQFFLLIRKKYKIHKKLNFFLSRFFFLPLMQIQKFFFQFKSKSALVFENRKTFLVEYITH